MKITKRQEAQARAIVQRAMDQARARDNQAKLALMGRCFKYRNSFSDGEPWWLYAEVTSVEAGRVSTKQFEHDSMGQLTLRSDRYGGLLPSGGWIEIPRAEFERALTLFGLSFLNALVGRAAPEGQ